MARLDARFLPPQAIRLEVEKQSSDFTAENGKFYVCNGPLNVQLPAPSASFHCVIKDETGAITANPVSIIRNGTELIDNVAQNFALDSGNQALNIISDGVDWFIY